MRPERSYDGSIEGLFALLEEVLRGAPLPARVCRLRPVTAVPAEPDLFSDVSRETNLSPTERPAALPWNSPLLPAAGGGRREAAGESLTPSFLGLFASPAAQELAELSVYAYSTFLYAWMSELAIEPELLAFAAKVFAAARDVPDERLEQTRETPGLPASRAERERLAAERAARDRADPVVETVAAAAYKTRRESHRLAGLLRFAEQDGLYAAFCTPDHFVFPALAPHFYMRFATTPWAVVDERRRLALFCPQGTLGGLSLELFVPGTGLAQNVSRETTGAARPSAPDAWTDLWKRYHEIINNPSRANPRLQRQFMPERYWKYLPEIR